MNPLDDSYYSDDLYEPEWEPPPPFKDWEYDMFLPRLIRELEKQVVAHRDLVRLRLYLYSNIDGHANRGKVEIFWIKFGALLEEAIHEGKVVPLPDDPAWVMLPHALKEARELYPQKSSLYRRWKELAGTAGFHLEDLVREALYRAGYLVGPRRATFEWNGESIELDAFAIGPLRLGIEAKNKFSEVYHSPEVSEYETEDLKQIKRFFRFCSTNGIIPILVASLVDRTFYSFQHNYGALHCCLKFQLFSTKYQTLCDDIRRQLMVGNVQSWDDPPPWMQKWFDAIPQHYRKRYKTDPPWVAA